MRRWWWQKSCVISYSYHPFDLSPQSVRRAETYTNITGRVYKGMGKGKMVCNGWFINISTRLSWEGASYVGGFPPYKKTVQYLFINWCLRWWNEAESRIALGSQASNVGWLLSRGCIFNCRENYVWSCIWQRQHDTGGLTVLSALDFFFTVWA